MKPLYFSTVFFPLRVILGTTVPKITGSQWTKIAAKKPTVKEDGEYTYTSEYGDITVTVPNLTDPVWTKDAAQHVDPTENEDGKDVYTSDYGTVEVVLPATGSISKQVQSSENAPAAKLPASGSELAEAVLTDTEKSSVKNDGAIIKIILTVDDATNGVSTKDKTAVEKAIGGLTNYKPGQYLDVNLFKVINGVQNPITETKAAPAVPAVRKADQDLPHRLFLPITITIIPTVTATIPHRAETALQAAIIIRQTEKTAPAATARIPHRAETVLQTAIIIRQAQKEIILIPSSFKAARNFFDKRQNPNVVEPNSGSRAD